MEEAYKARKEEILTKLDNIISKVDNDTKEALVEIERYIKEEI